MKKTLIASLLLVCSQSLFADNLLEVYKIALERDPVLREAAAKRESQREAKPLALSQLLPQVGVSGNTRYKYNDFKHAPSEDYSLNDLSIGVNQAIYRRDRLMRLEESDWQVELADDQYRVAQQDLMLRVAKAYFNVLSAQETLDFVRADKKAIARQLEQAKQRFEVGLIAITGVYEAQARHDQSVTNEILAMNELDNAWEELRKILGIRPEMLADLKKEIPLEPPMPADIDEWSSIGMQNSPDVKAASDATQIAQREIEVQRSGHYPTLDLFGSYGVANSSRDQAIYDDVNDGTIGLALNVPIYQGGGVVAATRQARADLIAAQERLDQARRETDQKVRNAYRALQASISAVKSLKAGIVSAKSALDATTAGFDVGTRTMVDVLNSQRDYYRAQQDHAKARYTYMLAALALKRAAGILTEEDLAKANTLLTENSKDTQQTGN
ncbi:MAG: type I secretion protein TolC [Gammaproteobacteria bacterium]|nr:MAG: type I secretion protein TolC [Gammaproteobacteria bacterium]RTZ81359.1 MAG: type I secretion protein TolC [Gammaproteobacteria bacterium]